MIKYYQLGTLLFFITTCIFFKNYKEEVLTTRDLRHLNILSDSLHVINNERLSNYLILTLELNKECEQFKSSRESKRANK